MRLNVDRGRHVEGGLKGCVLEVLLCIRYATLILRLKVFISLKRERRVGLAGVGTKLRPLPNAIFWCVESSTLERVVMKCSLFFSQIS